MSPAVFSLVLVPIVAHSLTHSLSERKSQPPLRLSEPPLVDADGEQHRVADGRREVCSGRSGEAGGMLGDGQVVSLRLPHGRPRHGFASAVKGRGEGAPPRIGPRFLAAASRHHYLGDERGDVLAGSIPVSGRGSICTAPACRRHRTLSRCGRWRGTGLVVRRRRSSCLRPSSLPTTVVIEQSRVCAGPRSTTKEEEAREEGVGPRPPFRASPATIPSGKAVNHRMWLSF